MKKAHHHKDIKNKLVSRLNRIEGQIRGIARMIREDVYCNDALNQMRSVDAALNGVKMELLEAHMRSCVIDQIKNEEFEIVDELVETIGKLVK